MSTIVLNMHEAKTRLSEVVAQLRPGDRVVLCRRNRPVAEIRPLPASSAEPRPVGLGKGLVEIPPSFFEPLPKELVDAFEGKG
jgi:antitoxin (DNA-binding transcriptional repressor) of toxin-antitoxin stability system